jgi:predicted DNA-binding transcriptional regulator AlpA
MSNVSVPLIIRRSQLKTVLGIAPSTVDRLEKAGQFPQRKKWNTGVVGWDGSEVVNWVSERATLVKEG